MLVIAVCIGDPKMVGIVQFSVGVTVCEKVSQRLCVMQSFPQGNKTWA